MTTAGIIAWTCFVFCMGGLICAAFDEEADLPFGLAVVVGLISLGAVFQQGCV